jgi:CRISPR-associated endonuclease/helicase Cas3
VTSLSFDAADYRAFFRSLTGFDPLPFQEAAAQQLLAGRNLVITAPTGSGKTWAVVAPYLYALDQEDPIADRLQYALPLRSLADALCASVRDRLARFTVRGLDADTAVRMQSGSTKEDPFFQGRITFTTLDQLLSGYLTVPVSLGDRLGNINAGALVGAHIVFDEVHLLEPTQALGTAIEMGQRLRDLAQVTVMTATLPQECVDLIRQALDATHIDFSDADLDLAPHLQDRQRRWTWIDRPLAATDVLASHNGGRTLAICNTVSHAQQVYRELISKLDPANATRCILLHSRFLPNDRQEHEIEAAPAFLRDATMTNVIAVTTQVVEAGMDWGADTLHTELAPASALVQRAGRCARFPQPRNRGSVLVYELQQIARGERAVGPYRDANGSPSQTVSRTYEEIKVLRDTPLGAGDERTLVERVHKDTDLAVLRGVVNDLTSRARSIERDVFEAGERGRLSQLIRDADSVNVLVTSSPETLDLERGPQAVSIPRLSLAALRAAEPTLSAGGAAKQPQVDDSGAVTWENLPSLPSLMRAPWLVALAPTIAGYSSEFGLVLGEPGAPMRISYAKRPPRLAAQYSLERWTDHAKRVAEQSAKAEPQWQRAAARLDAVYSLPRGTTNALLEITCLLHDFGKLSRLWQDAMQGWQRAKDAQALAQLQGSPVAHTDFDPRTDRNRQLREFRQPNHAVEGACAAAEIVWSRITEVAATEETQTALARCVVSAIARHHSPRTRTIGAFAWVPAYRLDVETVLDRSMSASEPRSFVNHDRSAEEFCTNVVINATEAQDRVWLPLYWFLVRNLRLADQASQAVRQEVSHGTD